ncbi:MAG: hypothetical protein ACYTGB_07690, partial [Planctomycetota bacterium]
MRRLLTCQVALAGLLLVTSGAGAGEPAAPGSPPPQKLTLAEAVARALASAERVGAARASLAAARAAVAEARAGGLPAVSVDAGFGRTKRELTES